MRLPYMRAFFFVSRHAMIQEDAYKEVEAVDTRFVSEIDLLSHASRLLCPFFFPSLYLV